MPYHLAIPQQRVLLYDMKTISSTLFFKKYEKYENLRINQKTVTVTAWTRENGSDIIREYQRESDRKSSREVKYYVYI